jgi:chromosome segregation ATPase
MDQLKNLVNEKKKAEGMLSDAEGKLESLKNRLADAEVNFPSLQYQVKKLVDSKAKTLDDHVLGNVNQEAVDQIRKALDDARREETEGAEMIDSFRRGVKTLEARIPELKNLVMQKDRDLWAWVRDSELEKVRGSVPGILRAYAAQLNTGYGDFPRFLQLFFGHPDPGKMEEFQAELSKKYDL